MTSFRELKVWQASIEFTIYIYSLTKHFPKNEQYSLTDQIQRASVSIASNIAEGYQRQSRKEFINFLHISYGSCAEVETQLTIAEKLSYIDAATFQNALEKLTEIEKMLNGLIRRLKSEPPKP